MRRTICYLAVFSSLLAAPLLGAGTDSPSDVSVTDVRAMLSALQESIQAARARGDDPSGDGSAAVAEIQELWAVGRASPASEAGKLATEEAIHQLIHLGRYSEAAEKVELLAPDEPSWPRVLEVLLEAGGLSGDYDACIDSARERLAGKLSQDERTHALFVLGSAYKASDQKAAAVEAFREIVAEAPESRRGQRARGHIHELLNLNPGQPAPLFEGSALDGGRVALADLRGRVVLMSVWASW